MARSQPPARIVYQEFGPLAEPASEEVVDLPPQQQNVRIQATRSGRKGKTVTVLTGLQLSTQGRQTLLKALKNICGSGGTLKDDCLEIQGDQREKILAYLLKQGYRAKISGG
ncbi:MULTISPECIES: translation initiation factor [unclassified Synechocystis]|uniref:translation initiation factor n=1 Tax=unclassified Synechocystis TaxID=2640012 RepID=UPI00040D5139|nr:MULTISPECIES: translation initiation factor [unclassified Synechocystis]AIE72997.1 Translation initiation factor SUI1-related protein [Synechocystis sp. PCC 6714]MCT0253520.1 translation initiation factor [Synechocystis sp. CS-94]